MSCTKPHRNMLLSGSQSVVVISWYLWRAECLNDVSSVRGAVVMLLFLCKRRAEMKTKEGEKKDK